MPDIASSTVADRQPIIVICHLVGGPGGSLGYVVDGIALIQSRGGKILEARPGDVIWTPPGEEHWHGAAPDHFMTHIALGETDDVDWLEHVTDSEYGGSRHSTRA